jgi:hypothetical protein
LAKNATNVVDCSELFILSAIGGAGKTSVVGKLIGLNNLTEDSNVFFGGPNVETANNLKKSVTDLDIKNSKSGTWIDILENYLDKDLILELKTELQAIKNLEDGTIKNYNFKYFIKDTTGYYIVDLNKISFTSGIKSYDYIFFDESTNIPLGVLQIFNEISKTFNTNFILFGDDTQMGERQTIEDVFAIRPIRLNFSMRDSNSLKKQNNNVISNEIFSIQTKNNRVVSEFIT